MEQDRNDSVRPVDWLGLHRLAQLLQSVERGPGRVAPGEVVDRIERTLEILALVEDNTKWLREEARHGTPHETMELASDLRRLANRLEAVGAFVLGLGNDVIELEEQVLVELDDRIRRQSAGQAHVQSARTQAQVQAPPGIATARQWATVHAA